jgi:glucose/arabinose dehydrogenase
MMILTQLKLPVGRNVAKAAVVLGLSALTACGGNDSSEPPPPTPPPQQQQPPIQTGTIEATVLAARVASPWGLAFLPDGRMLITQKAGAMLIVRADGSAIDATVGGVPAVNDNGQGGLLDVALDPDFAANGFVYLSYAEDRAGGSGTALARGQLVGNALRNVAVLWRQQPKTGGSSHYGSRIVFRSDGTLYLTLGERARDDPAAPTLANAQNVGNTLGKVVRLNRDGSVPAGNPVFAPGALAGLWSIGHRNPQGAALRPGSDELWLSEHGPQGGDEVNRVLPGRNYGWPLRSYGCPYGAPIGSASRVGGGMHAPNYEEPMSYWVPTSTAPAGMAFYSDSRIAEWQGNLFVGALAGRTLWRFVFDANGSVAQREEVDVVKALGQRIRDVRQGPDGWLYLLSDEGRIIRVGRG